MSFIAMPTPSFKVFGEESNDFAFEKTIGRFDNKLPIGWLERLVSLSRAVCRIRTRTGYGTGWLINNGLVITNNHVIGSNHAVHGSTTEFGFRENADGVLQPGVRFNIIEMLETDRDLDFSVLRVDGDPAGTYGYIDITNVKKPLPDDINSAFPVVVQHPSGGPMMWSGFENELEKVGDDLLWYTSDTMPGSSGSVVLGMDLKPMALHHAGGLMDTGGGDLRYLNEGVLLTSIVRHLLDQGILNAELSAVERFKLSVRKFVNLPGVSGGGAIDVSVEGKAAGSALQEGVWDKVRDRVVDKLIDKVFKYALDEEIARVQAEGTNEIVPVLIAAAGVASGAGVAHWAHRTSKESKEVVSGGCTLTFDFGGNEADENVVTIDSFPNLVGASDAFDRVYDELVPTCAHVWGCDRRNWPPFLGHIQAPETKLEAFPLVGVFLSGVAAGAAAYKAGK